MAARTLDARAARLVAADLLSRRPWTRAELESRLRRRGAPDDVAAAVVSDLAGRGDVDDAAFALRWVEARAGRGYGPTRLAAELRARGVDGPLIEAALAALDEEAVRELARAAAVRRLAALARVNAERAAARLRDHLVRRGFPPGVVAGAVREALATRVVE